VSIHQKNLYSKSIILRIDSTSEEPTEMLFGALFHSFRKAIQKTKLDVASAHPDGRDLLYDVRGCPRSDLASAHPDRYGVRPCLVPVCLCVTISLYASYAPGVCWVGKTGPPGCKVCDENAMS
jgi:hypothetical protein